MSKTILSIIVCLLCVSSLFANTQRYRLMFNNDPAHEVTIAWEQSSGSSPAVYYGTTDYGTTWSSYPSNSAPFRSVTYFGMNNQFVKLTGLTANTVYYFVIKDSQGTSQRFWFKTCPDVNTEDLSFISGGDSRSGQTQRINANKMVAKIRPHAVLFGGDLMNSPSNTEMQMWLDDWQYTITSDNQMIPIVHSFGNHENYGTGGANLLYDLFDVPGDSYYRVIFGGDLFSMYTLNGELLPGHEIPNNSKRNAQKTWLQNNLTSDNAIWKAAQYHRPIIPHESSKGDGADEFNDWANLFYDNGVRLVFESDAHVVKITDEVRPAMTTASGSVETWFTTTGIAADKGITFLGEGSWGTLRTPEPAHTITKAQGSFYQFSWLIVSVCKIEIRTIDTQSPNSIPEHAAGDYFSISAALEAVVWKPTELPSGVIEITKCTPPVADFTANQTSVFTGSTVNFTDLTTNTPTSWAWSFTGGNPTSSTAQNPSIVYNTPGTYTVSLTATNTEGNDTETKTSYITVTVPSAPTANFTADNTSISVGETVNFTDLSTSVPTSWSWDFGDGGNATSQNPSYVYNLAGIYTVTLTATNSYGSDQNVKTNYITVTNGGSVDVPIININDDVEEANATGVLYFTSSDLEFCHDASTSNANQHVGLRFQNVNIPQGATITSAYIEIRADEAHSTATVLYMAADDADNSAAWSGNYNVSGRTRTTSEYAWIQTSSTGWTVNNLYQTPDITSLVQEVVARGGWSNGNSMSFILWDDGSTTGKRVGDSYDGGYAPVLHVDYIMNGTPPQAYCPSYYIEQGSEYITNVTFNTINNSTTDDQLSGYTDYTNLSTDINQSSTYQLNVSLNTNGNYTDHCQAFFDWNQDGDFADANELVDLGDITNVTNGTVTANVNVPAGATLGNTRMRINIEFNVNPGSCNADHASGWGETEDYTVNVIAAANVPVAAFTASSSSVCSGGNVNFTDASSNSPTSWSWNITGPATLSSTSQNPSLTFNTPGTYTVELVATNGNGSDTETSTNSITVNALPTVNAGTDQAICSGTAVTLSGSGASTYAWNNGVSNGVSFTPTSTTTYTVTGTAANGCQNMDQVVVTVNSLPTVNAGTDQAVCSGTAVTLSGSGASTYAWNNGVSNGVSFTPASTTTYTVTGTAANGCQNTDQVVVTVNSLPSVNAGADQVVCAGTAVTLSGSGASTYAWNNGVSNGVSFTPSSTTTFTVTGTAANGCQDTDQIVVTVNNSPVISLNSSNSPASCGSATGSIVIGGTGTGNISWSGTSSGNSNGITLPYTISSLTAGSYDVTFMDVNSCISNSITENISDPNAPIAPVISASGSTTICEGESVTLTSSYTTDNSWTNGASTQDIVVNTAGSYSVTYTDGSSCSSVSSAVTVIINTLPTVNAGADQDVCDGTSVTLVGTGAVSYNWDNGVTNGVSFVPAVGSTTYTVYGTDANGCQNEDQVNVLVHPLPVVTLGALSDACLNDAAFTLSQGSPVGGTYSGTGISGNMFDPSAAGIGSHTVIYSYQDANSCTNEASQTILVEDCSGLETLNTEGYKIYPNPADEYILIERTDSENQLELHIFDDAGRLIQKMSVTENPVKLDVHNWEAGIYTVVLSNGIIETTHEIVIK